MTMSGCEFNYRRDSSSKIVALELNSQPSLTLAHTCMQLNGPSMLLYHLSNDPLAR